MIWRTLLIGALLSSLLSSPVAAQDEQGLIARCRQWRQSDLLKQARNQCQLALAAVEAAHGPDDALVALPLSELAAVASAEGDYSGAERYARRVLALQERTRGLPRHALAVTLNNLGSLLQYQGNYGESEGVYLRALQAVETTLGPSHLSAASVRYNLGLLAQAQGRYEAAEVMLSRALRIRESALGGDHVLVAAVLGSLAALYQQQQRCLPAEMLYNRARAITEAALGPEHAEVARSLHNLATLHHRCGDKGLASALYLKALRIWEKTLGVNHPEVGSLLANLGALYQTQGRYQEASALHQRVFTLRVLALGADHPLVGETLYNLAASELAQGREATGLDALERGLQIFELQLRSTVSEARVTALLEVQRRIEESVYTAASLATAPLRLKRLALALAFLRKGRAAEAGGYATRAVQASLTDPVHQAQFAQWQRLRAERERLLLAGPSALKPEEYQSRLTTLRLQADDLEHTLAVASPRLQSLKTPESREVVARIAAALPRDGVLYEIIWVQGRGGSPDARATEGRYLGFFLFPDQRIVTIDLGSESILNNELIRVLAQLQDRTSRPLAAAHAMYQRLFAPIEAQLTQTRRMYFSPDGVLHLTPLAALHDSREYLLDRFEIIYLTSSRDLLRTPQQSQGTDIVVFADPAFSRRPSASLGTEGSPPAQALSGLYGALTGIQQLPGTRREALAIRALWPQARILWADAATEGALREVRAPRLLHVATHGLFMEDLSPIASSGARALVPLRPDGASAGGLPQGAAPSDPAALGLGGDQYSALSRSALLLSGAAHAAWSPDSTQDGILTAEEVRDLDLWGTELVVLSACETGLGAVRAGQGVYGLRRAFLSAGAETLVTSLWRVADAETSTLMTTFYQRLSVGRPRATALRDAMVATRAKHPHPYYWAPFILIGRDAPLRSLSRPELPRASGAIPTDPSARD